VAAGSARRVLIDGLVFPEGPRWRDGKLWFSDMLAGKVMRVDLDGHAEIVATSPGTDWL
jgi:sugar lactone lactonase YvrE